MISLIKAAVGGVAAVCAHGHQNGNEIISVVSFYVYFTRPNFIVGSFLIFAFQFFFFLGSKFNVFT